jgi:hypothetical protein
VALAGNPNESQSIVRSAVQRNVGINALTTPPRQIGSQEAMSLPQPYLDLGRPTYVCPPYRTKSVLAYYFCRQRPVRTALSPLSTMPRELPPPIRAARCATCPLSAGKSATTLYSKSMCRAWFIATCSDALWLWKFGSLKLHLASNLSHIHG